MQNMHVGASVGHTGQGAPWVPGDGNLDERDGAAARAEVAAQLTAQAVHKLVRQHKDQQRGPLHRRDRVRHGHHVRRQLDAGKVPRPVPFTVALRARPRSSGSAVQNQGCLWSAKRT